MEQDQVPGPSRRRNPDKQRKKDPRSWENISKAISAMPDVDKLKYISEKYKEIYEEQYTLKNLNQQLTKQCTTLQKEKEQHQTEMTKSMVTRARLEGLCRELQKQNKLIKDENLAKIKEEEERRKQVSSSLATKLDEINHMMDDNKEKNEVLKEENLKMTARLAELYAQFQKREDDITKMSNQLELERQYSIATIKKMELEAQTEKQIHAKEQALMKSNLDKSEANCAVLSETVKGLQNHIDVYKQQYEDFESTMTKSAKVFDNFKAEIANMTKQVSSLENEAQAWKNKFHDSMKALVELSEIKKNQDIYVQSLDKKNEQLNKLCRQLQSDRSNYLKLLKANGIEPTSTPENTDTKKSKLTKKEKELEVLRENLQSVQNELLMRTKENESEKNKQVAENGSKEDGDLSNTEALDKGETKEAASGTVAESKE